MRIENKKSDKELRSHIDRTTASVVRNNNTLSAQHNFQDVLQEQSFAFMRERLDKLLESLDTLGEKLVKTFSISDLITYKRTLQGFLGEVLQQIYSLKEESGWTLTGRPKLYHRIELINQELADLTKIVMEKQKDAVKLLKKLDSIRGLLVDLYS